MPSLFFFLWAPLPSPFVFLDFRIPKILCDFFFFREKKNQTSSIIIIIYLFPSIHILYTRCLSLSLSYTRSPNRKRNKKNLMKLLWNHKLQTKNTHIDEFFNRVPKSMPYRTPWHVALLLLVFNYYLFIIITTYNYICYLCRIFCYFFYQCVYWNRNSNNKIHTAKNLYIVAASALMCVRIVNSLLFWFIIIFVIVIIFNHLFLSHTLSHSLTNSYTLTKCILIFYC